MKKLILSIAVVCAVMFSSVNGFAEETIKTKVYDVEYETADHFLLKSKLTYPQEEKAVYPLVVLLHSLGYSSGYWENLKPAFLAAGVAVLEVDLKGHGKSTIDKYLKHQSWIYFSEDKFKSYPSEVANLLKVALKEHKKLAPEYISYVGADIGASTAIGAARLQPQNAVCLVLLSPHIEFKGIESPISLANVGSIPVFAAAAKLDLVSVRQLDELKKYAQGTFESKIYPNGGTGMLMLKANKDMDLEIVNWVVQKINEKS